MKSARVKRSVHDAMAPAQQRFRTTGKIRPGIKVLTNGAIQAIKGAEKIYAEGLYAGVSFDDIEKQLKRANPKYQRRPLMPRNAPYFRAMQQDFAVPGAAEAIMKKYGEDKREGSGRQLYTFPIEFLTDSLDANFREQFEAWKASELYRWSETVNGELHCMKREEVQADQARRRHWGPRPVMPVGKCNPNACDVFAAGNCQHNGTLYFTIPGCEYGVFELSFTSVYASLGIAETCDLVERMMGRVRGTLGGADKPLFWITKQHENVSRVDWEKGKATRQDQWIITLVPNLKGIAEYLRERNERPALPRDTDADAPRLKADVENPVEDGGGDPVESVDKADDGDDPVEGTAEDAAEGPTDVDAVKVLREELSKTMKAFDPPWIGDDLREYMEGNDIPLDSVHDEEGLRALIGELQAFQNYVGSQGSHTSSDEKGVDKQAKKEPF